MNVNKLETLLSSSNTINSSILTCISSVPVQFIKTGSGINFVITVPDTALDNITSKIVANRLRKETTIEGLRVIGRILKREGSNNRIWPLVEEVKLIDFVTKATERFWSLIRSFSSWPSFNQYLFDTMEHNIEKNGPEKQFPLDYWWLTCPLSSGVSHSFSVYQDLGIFIFPESNTVPIFSSSLYAELVSKEYEEIYNTQFTPQLIPCLGCFLYGLSVENGKQVIKDGLLNNQWKIIFYTCEEDYSGAKHFNIKDVSGDYVLIGCRETYGPIWCERRWDTDDKWFSPECNPSEW